MIPSYSMTTLPQFVGRELGVSDWVPVRQERIDQFATCTGDHQWIHVDVERARRESPFGGPVAHGYLALALVAPTAMDSARSRRTPPPGSTTGWTKSASSRRSKRERACGTGSCSLR